MNHNVINSKEPENSIMLINISIPVPYAFLNGNLFLF